MGDALGGIIPPTTPAAPVATPPPAAPGGAAPPAADWTTTLSEDHRHFVSKKGFRDPAAVVDSYVNLEKLMGVPKDRLLKLPEKDDDPAWGEIHERLGKPKEAKEYNIPVPQGGSPEFAEWAKSTFHQLGLPKRTAESLGTKWNEYVAGIQSKQMESYKGKVEADVSTLRKDWGAAYDQQIAVAKQAARTFGVTGETIDSIESVMGHAGTMKLFAKIGSKLGEADFVGGGSGDGGLRVTTPEAAMHQIQMLRQDSDFVRRYTAGDAAARQKMDHLHSMAYPDVKQFG
jgi:hypothetical protein